MEAAAAAVVANTTVLAAAEVTKAANLESVVTILAAMVAVAMEAVMEVKPAAPAEDVWEEVSVSVSAAAA